MHCIIVFFAAVSSISGLFWLNIQLYGTFWLFDFVKHLSSSKKEQWCLPASNSFVCDIIKSLSSNSFISNTYGSGTNYYQTKEILAPMGQALFIIRPKKYWHLWGRHYLSSDQRNIGTYGAGTIYHQTCCKRRLLSCARGEILMLRFTSSSIECPLTYHVDDPWVMFLSSYVVHKVLFRADLGATSLVVLSRPNTNVPWIFTTALRYSTQGILCFDLVG